MKSCSTATQRPSGGAPIRPGSPTCSSTMHPSASHPVLNDLGARREVEETPYPRSGEPNPLVKLGIVAAAGGPTTWADLAAYPADSRSSATSAGGRTASRRWRMLQDRTQTYLDMLKISVDDGKATKVLRDTTGAWVESPGDPHFLDDGSFLLASERDGFKHLYHFAADGSLQEAVHEGRLGGLRGPPRRSLARQAGSIFSREPRHAPRREPLPGRDQGRTRRAADARTRRSPIHPQPERPIRTRHVVRRQHAADGRDCSTPRGILRTIDADSSFIREREHARRVGDSRSRPGTATCSRPS